MKLVLIFILLFLLSVAEAAPPMPVKAGELARTIAFGEEIFHDDRVRVLMVYRRIGECGRPVKTCPDVDLYIAYRSGDLGEEPKVYRLPAAKDWNVIGWQPGNLLRIVTALPDANVDPKARSEWKPITYDIKLRDLCANDC